MLLNRSVPDVAEKRQAWDEHMEMIGGQFRSSLAFMDESGLNTNMTPRYGRALGGERVVDSVPLNTPKSTTMISVITLDGPLAFGGWQGGTTKERFLDWVDSTLIPSLKPGQILIPDNLRVHHCKEFMEKMRAARIPVLFLPPYSPDKNPIEMLWSKVKTILRQLKIRDAEDLLDAVRKILEKDITPSDCDAWFTKAGYAPV